MNSERIAVILESNCFGDPQTYKFKEGQMFVFAKSMRSKENIDVYLPSVVLEELKRHIKDDLNESRKGLSIYYKDVITGDTERKAYEKMETEINDFLTENNIILIDCAKYVDMNEVFDWYFKSNSLFRGNKAEFPDAIILSSCKKYFEDKDYDNIYFITKDGALEKAISDYPKFMNFKSTNRAMTKLLGFTNEDYYMANSYIEEKKILESIDLIDFDSADSRDEIDISIKNFEIRDVEVICAYQDKCLVSVTYDAIVEGDINILDPYESYYDRETGTFEYPVYKGTDFLEINDIKITINLIKNDNNKIQGYEIVKKHYVDLTDYLDEMEKFWDLN